MTLTSQNVLDALSTVIDPEIRRPITDLNMVDEVVIDGSTVSVTILLTTAGCPLRNTISEDVHKVLGALDGVTDVKVTMDVMNDEQKKALRVDDLVLLARGRGHLDDSVREESGERSRTPAWRKPGSAR